MHCKYTLSDDKSTIKFEDISVSNLVRDEAFDIVFSTKKNAEFLIEECIYRAKKLTDEYLKRGRLNEVSPVLFNYQFNTFLVDIGFFMETIGEFIKEEIGADFTDQFYNLSVSSLKKDGDTKEIVKYIVSSFEIIHEILFQNQFIAYQPKAKKVENTFHFYKRNIIGKLSTASENEKIYTDKTIYTYIQIDREIVEEIVDANVLSSLFDNIAQLKYRVTKQTISNYRKEIQDKNIVESRTFYLRNTYDKFCGDE